MDTQLPSQKILGTKITNASKAEVLEYICKRIEKKGKKFYIVTPNPEILVKATRSKEFQAILNDAEVSLADGIGVLAAGRMLKKHIKERITGVDMMLELVRESAKRGFSIGLLGGRGSVAEETAKCLREKYPDLVVKFASADWPLPNSHLPSPISHIDILFVALGAPKQEEWIVESLKDIDVTCAMAVGGAFDYISGKVPRAPKLVRTVGMEWAFRLIRQPWRAKRQLALPVFAAKVIKERINS